MRKMHQALAQGFAAIALAVSPVAFAELPTDKIPNVLSLPEVHPKTWVYLFDTNFYSLIDERVVILDAAAETRNYKGQIGASQFASFIASTSRPELYVAESFFSRGHQGDRTDTITVYNKGSLNKIAEVILPGNKRAQSVTYKNYLQLVDNDRLLLSYNFSPTQSVTVIDLDAREIVAEVQTAGCSLVFPTGKRGFSSICGDGTMLTTQLDENGKQKTQIRSSKFFDPDVDPIFAKPSYIGGVAYFPSYGGMTHPIDMNSDAPKFLEPWELVPAADKGEKWRPGGWQIATGRADGKFYTLMHKNGKRGSHKDGGEEVWVYEAKSGKRLRRIKLKNWGVSIEVTESEKPYLVVFNGDLDIDIYDAAAGAYLRTFGDKATQTAFVIHAAK